MKFAGELKFPDIDHPGVPVQFVIDGTQAELIVEGESLGRWSLFDVRARRLIASAFEIDLDGTEVTFVAADPIDFAYRGVEHMAQTWASMKSKRIATRSIAVRKSRRGTKPSRIEDLRAAMESNLESAGPQPIPGEPAMPSSERVAAATETAEPKEAIEADFASDWDLRDQAGAIPLVGVDSQADEAKQLEHAEAGTDLESVEPAAGEPPVTSPLPESERQERTESVKSDEELSLEAEKAVLAEERARLEVERRAAEEREANLIEAYRLEVERLEAEREELRRQATEAAEQSAADRAATEQAAREATERAAAEEKARAEEEAAARAELEREAAEREERERQAREREAAVQAELERRVAEREAREREAAEREARETAERQARAAAERETAEREARETAERETAEREAAELAAAERAQEEAAARAAEAEEEEEPRPAAAFDASAFRRGVVDLDDLDEDGKEEPPPPPPSVPAPAPEPEPALAGAPQEKSGGGLMGAVKAAFRSGPKDHEHQFVEAPGGIGITRYVCEECGYVSISV